MSSKKHQSPQTVQAGVSGEGGPPVSPDLVDGRGITKKDESMYEGIRAGDRSGGARAGLGVAMTHMEMLRRSGCE